MSGRLARAPFGRVLANLMGQVDWVLQIGGMWAPLSAGRVPYTLFCDCTDRLGDRNPWSGVDFSPRAMAHSRYRRQRELYRGARAIFTASD